MSQQIASRRSNMKFFHFLNREVHSLHNLSTQKRSYEEKEADIIGHLEHSCQMWITHKMFLRVKLKITVHPINDDDYIINKLVD